MVCRLDILNNNLHSVITGKTYLHVLNKQMPYLDDILDKEIPLSIREACLSWFYALALSPFSKKSHTLLSLFAHEKLLIWIEVMSLLGEYDSVGPALLKAISWISVSFYTRMAEFWC